MHSTLHTHTHWKRLHLVRPPLIQYLFYTHLQIIIYSCTKTGRPTANTNANSQSTSRVEILDDQRRLTVAITRAKHKLILIGDAQTLECHTPFRCLLKSMSGINKMNLVDGQHGFQWTNVMQCLNDVLSPEVNRKWMRMREEGNLLEDRFPVLMFSYFWTKFYSWSIIDRLWAAINLYKYLSVFFIEHAFLSLLA